MVASPKHDTTTRRVELVELSSGQALVLPPEFRFSDAEVFATRDNETGTITISGSDPAQNDWRIRFLELRDQLDQNDPEVQSFMSERPLNTNFELRSVLDIADEDDLVNT